MLPKNFTQYAAIVKKVDTGEEIARAAIKKHIKEQEIIGIECDPELFEGIEKVSVVIYNGKEAYEYNGTIRKVPSMLKDTAIALYRGKEVQNREQERFQAVTDIHVALHFNSEKIMKNTMPFVVQITDISSGGVGIQTKEKIFEEGDCCSFFIKNQAIKRQLYARVVRIIYQEEKGVYQVGCVLMTDQEAIDAGLKVDWRKTKLVGKKYNE